MLQKTIRSSGKNTMRHKHVVWRKKRGTRKRWVRGHWGLNGIGCEKVINQEKEEGRRKVLCNARMRHSGDVYVVLRVAERMNS